MEFRFVCLVFSGTFVAWFAVQFESQKTEMRGVPEFVVVEVGY